MECKICLKSKQKSYTLQQMEENILLIEEMRDKLTYIIHKIRDIKKYDKEKQKYEEFMPHDEMMHLHNITSKLNKELTNKMHG